MRVSDTAAGQTGEGRWRIEIQPPVMQSSKQNENEHGGEASRLTELKIRLEEKKIDAAVDRRSVVVSERLTGHTRRKTLHNYSTQQKTLHSA